MGRYAAEFHNRRDSLNLRVPGAGVIETQEGWCRGAGARGVFVPRTELLLPFEGQWAA